MSIWQNLSHNLPDDAPKAAIAGVAGALVHWLTNKKSLREGLVAMTVGMLTAVYLGPIVAPMLEPLIGRVAPGHDGVAFWAFICGMSGISLSGLVMDLIRARRREIPVVDASEENPDASA